jgi:hypothetical protein
MASIGTSFGWRTIADVLRLIGGTVKSDRPRTETDEGCSRYRFKSGFGWKLYLARCYCDLIFRPTRYRFFWTAETLGPTR